MITEEQFTNYINRLSLSYEKLKDALHLSNLNVTSVEAEIIFNELSNFRDIACTALRDSHINKKFKDN